MDNEAQGSAEERSKRHFEDAATRKIARLRERGVLSDPNDMKPGKKYKKLVIHPGENGLAVHELRYTDGENLVVPQGAYVELDAQGQPVDETVRYFMEKDPERIELVDIEAAE